MYKYEVGQVVDNFKRHSEGVHFDIADDGATMIVFFQNPAIEEIEQFKSDRSFEIRFTELYGVIMITVKIGNLNWMDAPYSPHLSKNLTKLSLPGADHGLGLILMLVDADTGEIKSIRLIGLSERFSKGLIGSVMEQKTKEFDKIKYDSSVSRIFAAYKTNQIVKMSRNYCKIII